MVLSPPPVLDRRFGIVPAVVTGLVPEAARAVAAASGAAFFDLGRRFAERSGCTTAFDEDVGSLQRRACRVGSLSVWRRASERRV